MRRRSASINVTRLVAIGQLTCCAVGAVILVQLWRQAHDPALALLFAIAATAAGLTLFGMRVLVRERSAAADLARTMADERRLNATLEHAVERRTRELEDAQRVLQRMWWLGQQITSELNPGRVLERFLEAVVDIAQGDGSTIGLIEGGDVVRIAVSTGSATHLAGASVALATSAMGRVIRTGVAWASSDIDASSAELDPALYESVKGLIKGLAIVPISRRGECIGAVSVATRERRSFSPADLERIKAMSDLLSVSLENAELVEALRATESRLRTLFRVAPDAVLTVLESGRILEANDVTREMTGVDPVEIVGREIGELVAVADRIKLQTALDATIAGTPSRVEVTFEHDGAGTPVRRVVALAMSRVPEADPPNVLLVGRDMTSEREMRVRLMESDRLAAVGELVAGVAHEVNNPLSSISAFAQLLLRDGELNATQRDSLEVIRSETMRASQVVKDLLAFARRSDVLREPLDLNGLLARTLRIRTYQLSSNHIELKTDYSAEPATVVGDARQLQQVCLNLVTNAVQAMTARGSGTLFVSTRREGPSVVLEMRDTGAGIPEQARAHIFEPFFTTKGEGEGTGLGLSVSYGIVTAHGGSLVLTATSPQGTTFSVTLPAADVGAGANEAADGGRYVPRSLLAGMRLLFIDDEPVLRSGLQAFGKRRGFTVLAATDGAAALEMLRRSSVDAIVCNLHMPGMDGPAFHDQLRRDRPGLAARTMFITSDTVTTGGRLASIKQPILSRPFSFEALEEKLVGLMRGTSIPSSAGWP